MTGYLRGIGVGCGKTEEENGGVEFSLFDAA